MPTAVKAQFSFPFISFAPPWHFSPNPPPPMHSSSPSLHPSISPTPILPPYSLSILHFLFPTPTLHFIFIIPVHLPFFKFSSFILFTFFHSHPIISSLSSSLTFVPFPSSLILSYLSWPFASPLHKFSSYLCCRLSAPCSFCNCFLIVLISSWILNN